MPPAAKALPPSSLPAKLVGEFIGTYLLTLTFGCVALSENTAWAGVSVASVLMVSMYALGGISGGNFNPAVSIALGVCKACKGPGIDLKTMGLYIGVQIVAGILAAFSYGALFAATFRLEPQGGASMLQACFVEVLYTFVLCFVLLSVMVAKKNTPNTFYGIAVGSVVVAGAYGAGALSRGCFNPAVAIGVDIGGSGLGLLYCLHYTLAEVVGALVAVGAFRFIRPEDFRKSGGLASVVVSEFLGTFVLVLTVGLNVLEHSVSGAFSIAASLACMMYAVGSVSGGHFNCAVTLAVFASRRDFKLRPFRIAIYIAAQLLGAAAAAGCYVAATGRSFHLGPSAGTSLGAAAIAEVIFTFLLCYVYLATSVSKTTKDPAVFPLAVGACVAAGGNAVGAISGAALNPAVSFGIALGHLFADGSALALGVYTAAELIAGGLAAGAFLVTHVVDVQPAAADKGDGQA
uniref:Aquaporin n=1 Tax=Zooxanthella nutricula TaxID=1333877 RepID=A0A7S2IJF3_9DINO